MNAPSLIKKSLSSKQSLNRQKKQKQTNKPRSRFGYWQRVRFLAFLVELKACGICRSWLPWGRSKQINGFCSLEPARPTTLASPTDLRTEAANTIEEKGYELITKNPWPPVVRVLLIGLSIVCLYYIPALLCLFSPTLVMESGIRCIVLKRASPVTIRGLVGNNVFFKDCSTVPCTWHQKGTMFVVRLLFIAFLILLIAPGIIVLNITPGFSDISNLTHPFMRVCVTL